jgi:hypothetical protein
MPPMPPPISIHKRTYEILFRNHLHIPPWPRPHHWILQNALNACLDPHLRKTLARLALHTLTDKDAPKTSPFQPAKADLPAKTNWKVVNGIRLTACPSIYIAFHERNVAGELSTRWWRVAAGNVTKAVNLATGYTFSIHSRTPLRRMVFV